MSEVISGVLQGHPWKPVQTNSFIISLGTRAWSTLKAILSKMKWHKVTNTEEDRSIIQEDWRTL